MEANKFATLVNAIYYYDKPNVYRPSTKELVSKIFFCPRCKQKLSIPREMASCPVFVCPSCGFKIPHENVLKTKKEVEEYMEENRNKKKEELEAEVVKESDFIKESD